MTRTFIETRIVGYDVPEAIDAVVYDVSGPEGLRARKVVFLESLPLAKQRDFRFAIEVADQYPLKGFVVVAHAERNGLSLDPPVTATLDLSFERHATLSAELLLTSSCDAGCPYPGHCEAGICVEPYLDAEPPDMDAGPQSMDAGDVGVDSGGTDLSSPDLSSPDLSSPDLSLPSDFGTDASESRIDAGEMATDLGMPLFECPQGCMPCTDQSCDGRASEECSCNGRNRDCPCRFACSPGERCEAQCKFTAQPCEVHGRDAASLVVQCDEAEECQVDGRNAGSVQVDCKREGSCEVDCRGATECRVRCRMGAECLLLCSGPSCARRLSDCTPVDCGGGRWVCNRSCP